MQVRFKCVSAHKVTDGKNTFYDARLLAASASEQPAGVFIGDKPAGKLDLQRLASQPFQTDTEYVITIEEVPASAPAETPTPTPTPTPQPTVTPPAKTPATPAPVQTAPTKTN